MIESFNNKWRDESDYCLAAFSQKEKGAVMLVTTLILLVAMTLITLYGTSIAIMDIKMTSGVLRGKQAYDAAEAGLEFGITRFYTGGADQDGDGVIDTLNPADAFLADDLSGTITSVIFEDFTPSTKEPFSRIRVVSVGESDDGSITRTISQIVNFNSLMANLPDTPLTVVGDVDITGNLSISNTSTDITIMAKGTVSLDGSATTVTSAGVSSDRNSIGSDVIQNAADLAGLSNNDYFLQMFGVTMDQMKDNASVISGGNNITSSVASAASEIPVVWIDGDARLNSNSVIGSPDNPVIVICNGALSTSGTSSVYGMVYALGGMGSGSFNIEGASIFGGDYRGAGNLNVNYNPDVLDNLQDVGYSATLAGSWRDF